jgi:hypothetical protein
MKFEPVTTRWKRSGRCDPTTASLLRALDHFVQPIRALDLAVATAR